jgi:class 3 adenylate cyclase
MAAIRHIRVLVIEDDEFITMVYRDQLSDVTNIEFELDAYPLMEEGLAALKTGNYDVLLLDLNLPDSDYKKTIERIPDISYKLPVVIMTSANDELLALKTMNMGGQDYLVKSKLDRTLFIRSVLYSIERHQLREQLQQEKEKSDNLLRNILPEAIANELKSKGKTEARHYNEVSVMFVDFAGFTAIAAAMNPNELVEELHTCFSYFDEVTEKYGLEKIKTIGDAYMCAGGIPETNKTHANDMTNAAFEIMDYVESRYAAKKAEGKSYWRARIGIHVGDAIAGVVGSRKFTYDIWGDTVNTAARMESNSESGKINISAAAKEALKNSSAFAYESRGKVNVKGKGEMNMYYAEQAQL